MSDHLYRAWAKLGVGFTAISKPRKLIDLEKTIIDTARVYHDHPKLLFGMRAWLLRHHDLVNGNRLIRMIKKESKTAVLGAIIESILKAHPRSDLKYVMKYCTPLVKKEFLFRVISESKVLADWNRKENLAVWKKWGLISREMDDMEGAIKPRQTVLKNNPNLLLRVLFGAGVKAEILSYFMEKKEGNAHQIAQERDLSYERVYTELMSFKEAGLVSEEKSGLARTFHLQHRFFKSRLSPQFA